MRKDVPFEGSSISEEVPPRRENEWIALEVVFVISY